MAPLCVSLLYSGRELMQSEIVQPPQPLRHWMECREVRALVVINSVELLAQRMPLTAKRTKKSGMRRLCMAKLMEQFDGLRANTVQSVGRCYNAATLTVNRGAA